MTTPRDTYGQTAADIARDLEQAYAHDDCDGTGRITIHANESPHSPHIGSKPCQGCNETGIAPNPKG
jgi:hypothetical protein